MYDHPWKIRHALSAAVELLKAAQDVRLRAATALEDDTDTDWQSEHDRLYERMGTANEQISYVLDFALKARKSEEAVEAVGEIESTAFRVVQVFAEKTCCGLRAAGSIVYARKPSLLWLPGDTHVKPLCAYAEDLICNYTVEPDALDPAEDAEIRDLIARLEIEAGSIARQFPKEFPPAEEEKREARKLWLARHKGTDYLEDEDPGSGESRKQELNRYVTEAENKGIEERWAYGRDEWNKAHPDSLIPLGRAGRDQVRQQVESYREKTA